MHHIQKSIISGLAKRGHLLFSQLKPEDIENKLFDYHLKLTLRDGLVDKDSEGYALSSTGRKMWKRINEKPELVAARALSVLFLIVRNKRGEWLLYKRKTHPLLGRVGYMHCTPDAVESVVETAKRCCLEKTGLSCTFRVLGSGYFRVFEDNELESFTNFTLLASDNVDGILSPNDDLADYFWLKDPDFLSEEMLPNMRYLAEEYLRNSSKIFFIDREIRIAIPDQNV